jgi:hypothetical protein
MKRDWDLIKTILLKMEDLGDTSSVLRAEQVPGYDRENVSFHFQLLHQAELIVAECSRTVGGPLSCHGCHITWQGYEFLDTIRCDTIWNRIKKTAREKGLDLSFSAIKAIGSEILKSVLWSAA